MKRIIVPLCTLLMTASPAATQPAAEGRAAEALALFSQHCIGLFPDFTAMIKVLDANRDSVPMTADEARERMNYPENHTGAGGVLRVNGRYYTLVVERQAANAPAFMGHSCTVAGATDAGDADPAGAWEKLKQDFAAERGKKFDPPEDLSQTEGGVTTRVNAQIMRNDDGSLAGGFVMTTFLEGTVPIQYEFQRDEAPNPGLPRQ